MTTIRHLDGLTKVDANGKSLSMMLSFVISLEL